MWILRVPGSTLYKLTAHERWLRPGHSVTIGRSYDNDVVVEAAKSVSKQHVKIDVGKSTESLSAKIHERTQLVIEDLGSKFFTHLEASDSLPDGRVLKSSHQLTTSQISFSLGKVKDLVFVIYWKEFLLTLSNVRSKDVQVFCDTLDIRFQKEYTESTTHVVTNKYNTPKVLQALIQQKHIVAPAFIEAMHQAADRLSISIENMPSLHDTNLLPQDAFSEEFGHKIFEPTTERTAVFRDLQFIFFEKAQFKSLGSLISAGQGTAAMYEGRFDESSIATFLCALNRPVVVLSVQNENHTELLDNLTPLIGCASVTQADFIRIILSAGAHGVYEASKTRNLAPEPSSSGRISDTQGSSRSKAQSEVAHIQTQAHLPTSQTVISRRIGSRAVKALPSFEDDLFGGSIQPVPIRKPPVSEPPNTPRRRTIVQPFTLDEDIETIESLQLVPPRGPHGRTGSRRSAYPSTKEPSVENDEPIQRASRSAARIDEHHAASTERQLPPDYEDVFEIAPTAAAFERMRSQTQEAENSACHSQASPSNPSLQPIVGIGQVPVPESALGTSQDITEEEIQATLKANKQKADQARSHEDEASLTPNASLKNLGLVEFFPVDLSDLRPGNRKRCGERSEVEDSRWIGRKNFKKFRRQGTSHASLSRGHSKSALMIRLVESTPSDRGLLDKQWLERNEGRSAIGLQRDRRTLDANASPGDSSIGGNEKSSFAQNLPSNGAPLMTSAAGSARRHPLEQGRAQQQSLFLPDASDSDDDPLKFRL